MSTEKVIDVGKIIERLKTLYNTRFDKDLSIALGFKESTVSVWKSRNELDEGKIIRSIPPGTDLNWLFYGDSPDGSGAEYLAIPYRRQQAGAGPGVLVDWPDEPRRMAFRADWIRQALQTNYKNLFLMSARGDSMAPEIMNGDILLVDASQTRIRNHDTYIWSYGEGETWEVVVKQAEKSFLGPEIGAEEIITLRSVNPQYHKTDLEMRRSNGHQFRVEGRVVWIGRTLE